MPRKPNPIPTPQPLPDLTVVNRQRRIPLDLAWIRRVVTDALPRVQNAPGPDAPVLLGSLDEIAISIVSEPVMARVHRDNMGIDGPTDVMTFPYGEILICAAVAAENARHFDAGGLEDEIALYAIHGLLHLHGYDDLSRDAAARMRRMQAKILKEARKCA